MDHLSGLNGTIALHKRKLHKVIPVLEMKDCDQLHIRGLGRWYIYKARRSRPILTNVDEGTSCTSRYHEPVMHCLDMCPLIARLVGEVLEDFQVERLEISV